MINELRVQYWSNNHLIAYIYLAVCGHKELNLLQTDHISKRLSYWTKGEEEAKKVIREVLQEFSNHHDYEIEAFLNNKLYELSLPKKDKSRLITDLKRICTILRRDGNNSRDQFLNQIQEVISPIAA